jgi:Lamin Tail Domain
MRKIIPAVLLAVAAAVPLVATIPAQAATPKVVIREIFYNSPGSDTGSNASLNGEWVQLHNTTSRWVTMYSWTLRDTAGHVYTFPSAFRLPPHWYLKIHTGSGANTKWNRYQNRGWYVWNNNGDTAILKNASGLVKDSCSYSDPSEVNSSVTC